MSTQKDQASPSLKMPLILSLVIILMSVYVVSKSSSSLDMLGAIYLVAVAIYMELFVIAYKGLFMTRNKNC